MRREIEDYLRKNGARYTTKSLRRQLLHAGYEAPEVDAALEETEAPRAPRFAETKALRSQFWGLAFIVNLVVLVGVSAVVSGTSPYAGATFIVLGIAMLIGLGISGSIGSSLLPGMGLFVALAVPTVAALILGGACFAMMRPGSGGVQSTRAPGTMELRIDPPLAFSGSGAATCETFTDSFSVNSTDLGSIGDKPVSASVGTAPPDADHPADGGHRIAVGVSVLDTGAGFAYAFGGTADALAAGDVAGSISFEGLMQQDTGAGPLSGQDSISGTISWTCDVKFQVSSSNYP